MIEKWITIQNIGRFKDYKPCGDVSFRKFTLLFAENGRGKTTLCGILRSLQTGLAEFITERKTLGVPESPMVQIKINTQIYKFENNRWSSSYPDIAIFDSVFIHDNVYAGDYVEHEHKKNLYRVIIGSKGTSLACQIENLDAQIRSANDDIKSKKEFISKNIPEGIALGDYLAWQPIRDIENQIQEKRAVLKSLELSLEKATEIQSKEFFKPIKYANLPSEFYSILSKQLGDVTADAEERVRKHIQDHKMSFHGEGWISQGIHFIVDNTCPFCGQEIKGNELINSYKTYFNEAYRRLKQEVEQLPQLIASKIGNDFTNSIQQTILSNAGLLEFWKQFKADITLPEIPIEEICSKYETLQKHALALAQKKQQTLLDLVNPDEDFKNALRAIESLKDFVDNYNARVSQSNETIKGIKDAEHQRGDINTLRKEINVLEAKKQRFDAEIVKACEAYQHALETKKSLENQKQQAKENLDQYCEEIIRKYESSINNYLDQFNTGFRITNTKHSYVGGTPSSQYEILINNNTINLSGGKSGEPCFKTALSSGDRSALAFAFFLAVLDQDDKLANKIVVLDDPFTSQDRFRRTCTQQLICSLASKARQVIVLSHDPYFLKSIRDAHSDRADIKTLQLCLAGNGTVITAWDIEAETQSTYIKDYNVLLDFYRDRKGNPLDVARSIRPFIEGMLRAHFPGHFKENEWLGDFIKTIRNASDTDGLSHAKADVEEIEAINDYCKKYHHAQNVYDNSDIDTEELYSFVRRTLRLVGGCS